MPSEIAQPDFQKPNKKVANQMYPACKTCLASITSSHAVWKTVEFGFSRFYVWVSIKK